MDFEFTAEDAEKFWIKPAGGHVFEWLLLNCSSLVVACVTIQLIFSENNVLITHRLKLKQ